MIPLTWIVVSFLSIMWGGYFYGTFGVLIGGSISALLILPMAYWDGMLDD